MKVLTTGTGSGLGRSIHEAFGGFAWTRDLQHSDRERLKPQGVDVIIHCAFNSIRNVPMEALYGYVQDNVLLTRELVTIRHKKFIFISSVDVYPKDGGRYSEDQRIDISKLTSTYGWTKLMSEAIVCQHCPNYLILRCVSLLGPYMRKNSLLRILEDDPCTLTLTGDSEFNYVLHSDLVEFIRFSLENNLRGVYNVSSNGNISLMHVAAMLGKSVGFGNYNYMVGNIDNHKIASLFPAFRKTSQEVIKEFARQRAGTSCVASPLHHENRLSQP
jgi:nucleoside-diphosphate-sugar epimerase